MHDWWWKDSAFDEKISGKRKLKATDNKNNSVETPLEMNAQLVHQKGSVLKTDQES